MKSSCFAISVAAALAAATALPTIAFAQGGGQAGPNMIFHAQLDEHAGYANVWGYNAPNGQSYALLGATTGLAVINVSDPGNSYEAGFIPGPLPLGARLRSFSHYAYVVSEAAADFRSSI
jgi:hypothetical protein